MPKRVAWVVMKYIASISFGKDSLAMLIKLLECGRPVDEVVFFDTGMEFGCIYAMMIRVKKILDHRKIKFTRLKADKPFLYLMLEHEIKHRDETRSCGYKWCGGNCRWYTSQKTYVIKKYLNQEYDDYIEYIGIAADEYERIKKSKGKELPLVDWNMTERDCLKYCHDHGFYWQEGEYELYDYLNRVSCWCCRNKNLGELRNIYDYFKPYWLALCELERRCDMNMKRKSLIEYEKEWKSGIRLF